MPTTAHRGPLSVRGPRSWTLRAKLLASTIALFIAVSLGTGALVVLATQRYLSQQVDASLRQTVSRTFGTDGDGDHHINAPPPGSGTAVLRVGLRNGAVVNDRFGPLNSVVNAEGDTTSLSDGQIQRLLGAGIGSTPVDVDLGHDVGTYRVIAVSQSGTTFITGVPTGAIGAITNQLIGLVAAGTLLGLVIVGAGGTYLIRRNLAPLQRVAATASRVSDLHLDSGEVALAERVPDADPRTEVGQVGLALNNLLDNVDHALQARQESEMRVRQFVADASHELRTPLASIRGYAELSRREREPVPAAVTHALGRVESEALRMQGLVEDLLLLARLDAGRPLDHDPVDLTLLAMDAVSDARAASPEHKWELSLPDEPVEVPGDQARLHQVIANLLANARTHTPAGTRVVTSLHQQGDRVTLAVTDDGPGIPEALQRNVFERFVRGDEARTRTSGSTGLGLSIVSAVATAHGGRVGLRSHPGETTFLVELPA
ncbi:MAG: HAMP domain-containing sensor histidine kinase [Dermatophilaceae bacterium]